MTYGCVVRAKYIAQNCVRFIIIYTPSLSFRFVNSCYTVVLRAKRIANGRLH